MRTRELAITRALVATCLILLVASGSHAQSPNQSTCSISGTVVDAITNQPLRGASATIRGPMGSGGGALKSDSTVSDAEGRFSFTSLAPGRYMISATHAGYVNQGPGGGGPRSRTVLVGPGQNVDDFTVALSPGSVIAGHITDAASKPLGGVTVQVLKRRYQSGGTGLSEVSTAQSNKDGEYHIGSLMPGKYYLRAMFSEPPPPKPGSDLAYVPTYYPGTSDLTSTVPLILSPGEQLAGMDLTLKRQHTFTVRGRVADAFTKLPAPESELNFAPTEGNTGTSPYHATGDAKGNFELRGIPAGDYTIIAQQSSDSDTSGTKSGRKSIHLEDANLNGVEVLVARGVDVSGRIRVEGKAIVDLSQMTGTLEPTDNAAVESSDDLENASVKVDGSFAFRDVPEGSYRINFSPIPPGLFMKADAGESSITVTRGQALRGLDLVLSSGVARVEGTALDGQDPAAGAAIILVPGAGRRGQPRFYKRAVADRQGRFSMQGVIPGDYQIFAFEEMQRGFFSTFMDPDFLAEYEGRGKEVSLKEGETQSVQLDVISSE
jgi:hypothetical protein